VAKLLGWREWASLPDLGVDRVKVKVDTGARTSALHAFKLMSYLEDGEEWVRFGLHPLQRNVELEVDCIARVKDHRTVRDSGGHEEVRVVIETDVMVGEDRWPIELTLTDRENMGFRMLLGRNAIKQRFYVDPTQSFVLTSRKRKHKQGEEE
jgi:hypothetical protein